MHPCTASRNLRASCSQCHLADFCLAGGHGDDAKHPLSGIIRYRRKLERGNYLFRQTDTLQNLFAVRKGSLKTFTPAHFSHERITSFALPGDTLGFEAISHDLHTCHAVAMQDAEVCEIPFRQLQTLVQQAPDLQHRLHTLMSQTLIRYKSILSTLHDKSAERKLAWFLLDLTHRLKLRGHAHRVFDLPMTRREIGDFLGLELETVSRAFSQLRNDGLLDVDKQHIVIRNRNKLERLLESTQWISS